MLTRTRHTTTRRCEAPYMRAPGTGELKHNPEFPHFLPGSPGRFVQLTARSVLQGPRFTDVVLRGCPGRGGHRGVRRKNCALFKTDGASLQGLPSAALRSTLAVRS